MKAAILLLLALVVFAGCGGNNPASAFQQQTVFLVNASDTLAAGTYVDYKFIATLNNNLRNLSVQGGFLVQDGGDKQIRALIIKDDQFASYDSSGSFTSVYDSGPVTTASISVPITESGHYHIVLDNRGSGTTTKIVAATIGLQFEGRTSN